MRLFTPTLDESIGALLVGTVFSGTLWGAGCAQLWYYFLHYRQTDSWNTKSLVMSVWILDTLHQAFICHTLYVHVISEYANLEYLDILVWSTLVEATVNGTIGFLVQMFMAQRLRKLSKRNYNLPLSICIHVLILAALVCSIVFTVWGFRFQTWAQLQRLRGLSVANNALGVAGDVIIAAALCHYLHQNRSSLKRSAKMVKKLIVFTISTGVMTSICAIGSLISVLVWKNTLVYLVFHFSLGRLYTNSILVTLNGRKGISDACTPSSMIDMGNELQLVFASSPDNTKTTLTRISKTSTSSRTPGTVNMPEAVPSRADVNNLV